MAVALLKSDRTVAVAQARAAEDEQSPETIALLNTIMRRKRALEPEMVLFGQECDRWDNLYYPTQFATGGVSHWAGDPSARTPGRSHVSVNSYPIYVDIPASLQAVPPIENMVASEDSDLARELANAIERFFYAWKDKDDFELKAHQACVVKGLYGRTAAKVFWDDDEESVCTEIVDQPRNLYLGWRDSSYRKLDWALYTYRISAATALADWGLELDSFKDGTTIVPFAVNPNLNTWNPSVAQSGLGLTDLDLEVEVVDYWYRRPRQGAKVRFGKPTSFETWNAVFVGQYLVAHQRHTEYKGKMPYVPLFNTYLPGVPNGRAELRDIEQLIREKDERLSENAQMMSRAVNGQYWQLTGENAPATVDAGTRPVSNGIFAPGAGNRLEAIEPWMPEFQMEAYLSRIDIELADVSGLNDLLRGQAPNQVLSSGKAISALVANYETRLSMKRDLYYAWRRDVWELAADIWGTKNKVLKPVLDGKVRLRIKPPSLTPRDDNETAIMVGGLVDRKLMAAVTGMDLTGRDDPETEQELIRKEQSDAVLNPQAVTAMAALIVQLASQGITPQPGVQSAVGAQASSLAAGIRGTAPGPMGGPSMNDPNAQFPTAPQFQPGNTAMGAAMGAGGPPVGPDGQPLLNPDGSPQVPLPPPGQDMTLQTMVNKSGEAQSRMLMQKKVSSQAGP